MARAVRACRRKGDKAGPATARSPRRPARRPAGRARPSPPTVCGRSRLARAMPPRPGQTRRRGPAATARRRGVAFNLDRDGDCASAGPRAQLGSSVLALERARRRERGGQPQDFGRVERRVHSFRQVVPLGPSSNTMPSAFRSSRMRSAVAKSRSVLRRGSLGDARFDRARVRIALEPFVGIALRRPSS